jgi:signal transduction histidine kinase
MWEQIVEFFQGFGSTSDWPARWRCGYWSDFHGWMYIIADLMIWLAYFLIPLVILRYALRRKNIQFYKAYLLFAAFILLCGATHFLDALMFWVPLYRVNAVVRLITGIVSLITVYHLIKLLPIASKLRTTAELEAEISQRERAEHQLEAANRKLAESNKGLEAFAYVASHDLQEPLRKIKTFSTFMQERSKLDETGITYMNKIVESTDRMSRLIEDVLSLSSLKEDVEMKVLDPNRPINNALQDLELKISERNAVVRVEELPKIKGNEAYLTQLFFNLINNAIKFTEKQPVITISGEQKDGMVLIRVSDNGIGIPEEHQQKIFEAFSRLHARHVYEGTGIGLAICKKIIDIHDGEISVQSKEGEGTTFVLKFQWAFKG